LVPYAPQVIFLTGLFEFAAAAALISRRWRGYAGIALAIYSVCVLPANIKHAVEASTFQTCPQAGGIMAPGSRRSR
jgi:uncharacterized membrane protein